MSALVLGIRDLLSLALALIILFGLGLLRFEARLPGGALAGLVVLALVFADIAAYTLTGALSNLLHRESLLDLVIPASLAMSSLAGLASAVSAGIQRRNPEAGNRAAPVVGSVIVALFGLMLIAGLVGGQREASAVPRTDLVLQTENMAYSTTALAAAPGEVTVYLANHDLFWHTFTIDELNVSLQAPVRGEREITFTAAPGTYSFYCMIPGHALIGMRGTLTVR